VSWTVSVENVVFFHIQIFCTTEQPPVPYMRVSTVFGFVVR